MKTFSSPGGQKYPSARCRNAPEIFVPFRVLLGARTHLAGTIAAMHPDERSLQERYSPEGRCFGCGPANADGLRIRSFPSADDPEVLEAEWQPERRHEAFDGIVNGGVLGTLLDCHANWTAVNHLMRKAGLDHAPSTVTSEFSIRMRRPTPSGQPIHLRSWVVDSDEDRATVEVEIRSQDVLTATGRGSFVAVRPGHPAYGRW
jgi:acyl-coenzyme A thioesterase PaaI-like protein